MLLRSRKKGKLTKKKKKKSPTHSPQSPLKKKNPLRTPHLPKEKNPLPTPHPPKKKNK